MTANPHSSGVSGREAEIQTVTVLSVEMACPILFLANILPREAAADDDEGGLGDRERLVPACDGTVPVSLLIAACFGYLLLHCARPG
jgi:hypothetical protein